MAMLQEITHCARRRSLVTAVAEKARTRVSLLLTGAAELVPYSRIRGGHLEIHTASGWKRSTDLLNQTASS